MRRLPRLPILGALLVCLWASSWCPRVASSIHTVESSPALLLDYFSHQPRQRLEPGVIRFGAPNWSRGDRVHPKDEIQITILLRHRADKLEAFTRRFYEVTDPRHPDYGHYFTIDDITKAIGPDPQHAKVVKNLLLTYGVDKNKIRINRNRDTVWATMRAVVAEKIFQTKLHRYTHKHRRDITLIRASEPYSLPASVAPFVSFVGPLLRLPAINKPHIVQPPSPTEDHGSGDAPFQSCGTICSGFTTPDVLRNRYGFTPLGAKDVVTGNSMAVAEWQFQEFDTRDLDSFASQCSIETFSVDKVYGRNFERVCSFLNCIESLLDIEYISSVAEPVPLRVYYSPSYSLLDWITTANDNIDIELVHSVSYGNDEAQQVSTEYMESVNVEFQKAGIRGVSILFASGDQGVWGREGTADDVFHPDFPASSPYVTAVGGTNFVVKSVIGDEEVWNGGGGGFSDTFEAPSYQTEAITNYLMVAGDALPPQRYWNRSGRAYPDVSALAGLLNPYCVSIAQGSFVGVGGTSAASPVVAGVFAQLNNLRLEAGQPSLGFLNPFIYQNPGGFHDVTVGVNDGGYGVGFPATAGWDPASGMGTPNYEALKKLVMR